MLMESRRSTFYVVLVNLSEGERLTGGMRLDYKWRLPNIAIVAKVINKSMFFLKTTQKNGFKQFLKPFLGEFLDSKNRKNV